MKAAVSVLLCLTCWVAGILPANAAPKVLMVVASRNYLEREYEDTRRALEAASLSIELASDTADEATGYTYGVLRPDRVIGDADPVKYAAVVIIGGYGARDFLWNHDGLRALVRHVHERGGIVAALCAAPPVLARAGLLDGQPATMWPDKQWIAALEAGGAHYVSEPVVIVGRVITGRDPAAATAFGKTVANTIMRQASTP